MHTDEWLNAQPGQGVNLRLKTTNGFAVHGEFTPTVPDAPGAKVDYSLTVITSQDDLMQTLNISGKTIVSPFLAKPEMGPSDFRS